jgi:thioredoxin 1
VTRARKVGVVAGVVVAAAVVLAARPGGSGGGVPSAPAAGRPVPRLVDVGAGKCIPCKAMAPILEQLRADYAGRLEVTFVDAWKFPDAAAPYRIHLIPTQIFYAADGRELARHEGFMSREDILARWKALGVEL